MEKIDCNSVIVDQKQPNTPDKQQLSIQHCTKFLVHACKCKEANCRVRDCQRTKKVVQHAKKCSKSKTNGGCSIRRQLLALCCFHAHHCQEPGDCPIPFCINIKSKLKIFQLQKRFQRAQNLRRPIMRRCFNYMQNRRMFDGLQNLEVWRNPKSLNSSSQSSSVAQPHSSGHSQSDTGINPSSGPPIGALLAVQQVQAAAAKQAQAQLQNPMSLMMAGIPNYMLNMENVASWGNSRYDQNHQSHQNIQHLHNIQKCLQQQLQVLGGPSSASSSIESRMGLPQVMPNPSPSVDDMQTSTEDWQQLFQTLRISNNMQTSAEDWQQLFQTLRISNTSSPPPPNSSYSGNCSTIDL